MKRLNEFYRTGCLRWERLEQIIRRAEQTGLPQLGRKDLKDLGALYRSVASDLAYARTRRLNPDTIGYLNNLVGRAHAHVYIAPALHLDQIGLFFRQTLPAILHKRSGFIFLAFLLMASGFLLGLALQHYAPAAAGALVPKSTSEGLYERFEKNTWFNNPLAERPLISAAIMANNIKVAVLAFAGGILLGTLTLYALFTNGIMLGVLTGVFIARGHGLDFWATILPHGVIELTAICLAGGAGLLLGGALINPGNYRRRDAVILHGKDALVIFLGVVVMLIVAGGIEGFISTIGTLGNGPRLAVAAGSGVLLYVYLLWPRPGDTQLWQQGLHSLGGRDRLP